MNDSTPISARERARKADLATSLVKPFVQVNRAIWPLIDKETIFSSILVELHQRSPVEWSQRKEYLKQRLALLHRLDICKDLDPGNEIDILRLWLDRAVVLSLDGGGVSVVWTLQLLKEVERIANGEAIDSDANESREGRKTCADIFDIVAGTSAGAITAALIGLGWSAKKIETEFWDKRAPAIWPYRNPLQGALLDALGQSGLRLPQFLLRGAFFSMDPPLVTKENFRKWAREVFGDMTMGQLCRKNLVGVFLVSTNASTGDTVPAGGMPNPFFKLAEFLGEEQNDRAEIRGRNGRDRILVRAAVEASASPPLHMQPLGPYMDAGAGPDIDPTLTVLREIYGLRAEQARRGRARAREEKLKNHTEPSVLERLERNFWEVSETLNQTERFHIQSRKQVTVFSFSTSMARSPQIPEKIVQKPLLPFLFWMQWILNGFFLKSSLGPARLLSEDETFPQVDYRRFQIAPGTELLRSPMALGPFDTTFARIQGISGASTSSVTEEDLYYFQWLLDPEYMRFHAALGQATVAYLRERTRHRDHDAHKQRRENYLNWLRNVSFDTERQPRYQFIVLLLGALQQLYMLEEDGSENSSTAPQAATATIEKLGLYFDSMRLMHPWIDPHMHLLTQLRPVASEISYKVFETLKAGLLQDEQENWESLELKLKRVFVGVLGEKLLNRRFLQTAFRTIHPDSAPPESTSAMEEPQKVPTPEEIRLYFKIPREVLDFDEATTKRECMQLAESLWDRQEPFSLKNYMKSVWTEFRKDSTAEPEPADDPNPFKYTLAGELLNHSRNTFADVEEYKRRSQAQEARELDLTMGNPQWVDRQPPAGARQGSFAFPLPSFSPPNFQESDNPLLRLNFFARENWPE